MNRTIPSSSFSLALTSTRKTSPCVFIQGMTAWTLRDTQPSLNVERFLAFDAAVHCWSMAKVTDWMTLQALMDSILFSDICAIRTAVDTSKILQQLTIRAVQTVRTTWTIARSAGCMTTATFSFYWKLPWWTKWATASIPFIMKKVFCTCLAVHFARSWACFTLWMAPLTNPCHAIRKCSMRAFFLTRKPNKAHVMSTARYAVIFRGSNASWAGRMAFYTLLIILV